jgi:hypothetical protein
MNLYELKGIDFSKVFGDLSDIDNRENRPKLDIVGVGQMNDCSSFLYWSKDPLEAPFRLCDKEDVYKYDFIYRQEWGITITDELLEKLKGGLKKDYRDKLFKLGCTTSIKDKDGNPIVVQCKDSDLNNLSITTAKTFIRDIDDVTHTITATDFNTILKEAKTRWTQIIQESWTI